MLTLYTDSLWISAYVFSCFVALREKGLEFEMKPLHLYDHAQKRPDYARNSLTARVPSLDHDGFWIAESSAIDEYLEDAFPAPKHARILPADLRERARARQILSWLRSDDTFLIREERTTTTMFYEPAKKPLTEKAAAAAAKLLEVADRVIPEGRPHLFGSFCIADADLAFMLHRLLLSGDAMPPKVKSYAEAQWKRPSIQAYVRHERPPYVAGG